MGPEDIELHSGDLEDRPYTVVGPLYARVGASTAISKSPTIEDVNFKLREEASKVGANAVVFVSYKRGISASSWKALSAKGTAVITWADTTTCPECAEEVKLAAKKCKHCGATLPANPPTRPPAAWYPDPRGEARMRYWDGDVWTEQTAK